MRRILFLFVIIINISINIYAESGVNIAIINKKIGGHPQKVYIKSNYAFIAAKESFYILDINDEYVPNLIFIYDHYPILDIQIAENYAVLSAGTSGLIIFDISNPQNPVNTANYQNGFHFTSIYITNNYLYSIQGTNALSRLQIISITNINSPIELGSINAGFKYMDVYAKNEYAYVADYAYGLEIIDISDKLNPTQVSVIGEPAGAESVFVKDNYAYIVIDTILRIFDISIKTNPIEIGSYNKPNCDYNDIFIQGDIAYLTDLKYGLRLINISNKANPIEIGNFETRGLSKGIFVSSNTAYICDDSYQHCKPGFGILDVSNKTNLAIKSYFTGLEGIVDFDIGTNYGFLADYGEGVKVVDINDVNMSTISEYNIRDTLSGTNAQLLKIVEQSNYIYLANYFRGFKIIDFTDIYNPVHTGSINNIGMIEDIAVDGNYVYLLDIQNRKLRIVNINDKFNPVEVNEFNINDSDVAAMCYNDDIAYVTCSTGIKMINVSNKLNPQNVGFINTLSTPEDVAVENGYIYIIEFPYRLSIYDVSDTLNPILFYSGNIASVGTINNIFIKNNILYITLRTPNNSNLIIYNVFDVSNPVEIGSFTSHAYGYCTKANNGKIYFTDHKGMYILNYIGALNFKLPQVENLTSKLTNGNNVLLKWNDVNYENNYKLFRNSLNDTNTSEKIIELSINHTNYSDTGLSPGTTYYYWVKAYNNNGSSKFSAVTSNTIPIYSGPFYVSTNGSDSNNGSFDYPFAAIQKAVDVMSAGPPLCTTATCYIFPGIYTQEVLISSNKNPDYMVITKLSNSETVLDGNNTIMTGINIYNADNVIIKDLTLKHYNRYSIIVQWDSTNNYIINNSVYSNNFRGIFIHTALADNNYVLSNNVWGNQDIGIYLNACDYNTVKYNNTHNNEYGIFILNGAYYNMISQNNVYSNDLAGISLRPTTDNTIMSNDIWGFNQNHGIYIDGGDRNIIKNNNIFNNQESGILITEDVVSVSVSNRIIGNNIFSNERYGICIDDEECDNNIILSNNIYGLNQSCGVNITNSDDNIVRENEIHNHQNEGIRIEGSSINNNIIQNNIYSNLANGILINSENADSQIIVSNIIYGPQNKGVLVLDADNIKIIRNLIYKCYSGIDITGNSSSNNIINNTIFSNTDTGIHWGNTGNGNMFNNIVALNGWGTLGYGIINSSSGAIYVNYNNIYDNASLVTNGNMIMGTGNYYGNSSLEASFPYGINSSDSPAVDHGTNIPGISDVFNGDGPDMGWKESGFTYFEPLSISINSVLSNQIDLIWNNIENETGYTLFRNLVNDTNTATNISGFSADQTNYSDTGLNLATTYYYWVKVYNINGSSGFSDVAFATTISNIPGTPPCPAWDLKTDSLPHSIKLQWRICDNLPHPHENFRFYVYRSTTPGLDVNSMELVTIKTGNTGLVNPYNNFNDTDVDLGTVYYYKIVTVDNNNLASIPSEEVNGRAGHKLKIKNAYCVIGKGKKPEISYRVNDTQSVQIKANIIDMSTGDIVYQVPEQRKQNEEFEFDWDNADQVRNGVYLVEVFMKREDEDDFKLISQERIVIVK